MEQRLDMFFTQSRSLAFGTRCIFCRGSGGGGSNISTVILNAHTSFTKFSTSLTPSFSKGIPLFVHGVYSSTATRPPNTLTISPDTGLVHGRSPIYQERLGSSRWVSGRRHSLGTTRSRGTLPWSSPVSSKTTAGGEGTRDETENRQELLGELEEDLTWEGGDDDLGERCDELDEADLERLGIKFMASSA